MSGKYNTRHPMRGQSRYPERLRSRGMTNVSVRMESVETLRKRQNGSAPTEFVFPVFNGKRNNWRRSDED